MLRGSQTTLELFPQHLITALIAAMPLVLGLGYHQAQAPETRYFNDYKKKNAGVCVCVCVWGGLFTTDFFLSFYFLSVSVSLSDCLSVSLSLSPAIVDNLVLQCKPTTIYIFCHLERLIYTFTGLTRPKIVCHRLLVRFQSYKLFVKPSVQVSGSSQ